MRQIILVFFILTRTAFASNIVLIDTGYSKNSFSNITIPVPSFDPVISHGQKMLTSLNDELRNTNTTASVEMISCNYRLDIKSCDLQLTMQVFKSIMLKPKIISVSIAGDDSDELERKTIEFAQKLGILIVIAAGNGGNGPTKYPAAYGGDCLISVGTLKNKKIAIYSKRAEVYIEQIDNETGTSYSTARVSGRAWSYWSKHPNLTCKEVKRYLLGK